MPITTLQINTKHSLYPQVYDLREEILRKPIGLSLKDEDLRPDENDWTVVALDGEEVLGCIMIRPVPEKNTAKFRQMAVKENLQGKGIGRIIMDAAEAISWENGFDKIVLHARVTAEDFYKKLNYTTTSDVFTEVGIPHVVMEKQRPDGL
jgi:predicted GNAT family N-acyltransferase